ncbi:Hypothetical protein CINCED_3A013578 [Cinara cedri]|nr:Hypothetical protein CINCED_3A013578 [Cinara cedri]
MTLLRVLLVVPIFFCFLVWLSVLFHNLPDSQCTIKFTIPKTITEIIALNSCLKLYYTSNYFIVLMLFSSVYIFKQSFCIPGSFILNLIAGSLFGTSIGFILVCTLSSIGVSMCYVISKICGFEKLLNEFFSTGYIAKIKSSLENLIQKNKDQLWYLLIVLRVIPITPNWFLNLVAPIVNIPLWTLTYTTFFGLMPYNYICCQSGQTLSSINSLDEIFTLQTTLQLMSIAVALIMVKFASKFCVINK